MKNILFFILLYCSAKAFLSVSVLLTSHVALNYNEVTLNTIDRPYIGTNHSQLVNFLFISNYPATRSNYRGVHKR